MHFYPYQSVYLSAHQLSSELQNLRLSPQEAYDRYIDYFAFKLDQKAEVTRTDYLVLQKLFAEKNWYGWGQPTYKIYPFALEALQRTHLEEIVNDKLELPYPVFVLSFPAGSELNGIRVETILAYLAKKIRDDENDRRLEICVKRSDGEEMLSSVTLAPGKTIEDQLNEADLLEPDLTAPGKEIDSLRSSLRLVVGVCLVATGVIRHQEPLLTQEAPSVVDKIKKNKKPKKIWEVGRNIQLPRAPRREETTTTSTSAPTSETIKREISYGYVRSGHFRLQPYGPKKEPTHYEMIFVAPTRVRPDLPKQKRMTGEVR